MILRLILGDQLNHRHSWYADGPDPAVTYVLLEMRQETDYARHHIQKVMAFFAAMRGFAEHLKGLGHRVAYRRLDDPENRQTLEGNLRDLTAALKAERLEYQLPDEWRLDQQLRALGDALGLPVEACDTEHFLTEREAVGRFFAGKKTYLLENFYRAERKRLGYLMQPDGTPEGGAWNFDAENREPLPKGHRVPEPFMETQDLSELHALIERAGVQTMGRCEDPAQFGWVTTREAALRLLEAFAKTCLPLFGTYEDAMSTRSWAVYHSRLSFAMNVKLLSPAEVVERCIDEYRARPEAISLAQIEGFVRQIVGWREYMRGIYWAEMPRFATLNFFGHDRPLPGWFWTGETRMNCLKHALGQSLDRAYAHHIQRLMVIGNFALLMGADPDAVDAWYLGVYIDAVEWVEITNTRGMSQYADGGIVGSKPYVSSGAYIARMSDYCGGCLYNVKEKTGANACPFNALYWHFYERNRVLLEKNPRIGMAYKTWDKMAAPQREALLAKAEDTLSRLEAL